MGKYKKERSGINTDKLVTPQAFEYFLNRYLKVSQQLIPLKEEWSFLSRVIVDYFEEYPGVFQRILKEHSLDKNAKEVIRSIKNQ
jgi:hypothetical protein